LRNRVVRLAWHCRPGQNSIHCRGAGIKLESYQRHTCLSIARSGLLRCAEHTRFSAIRGRSLRPAASGNRRPNAAADTGSGQTVDWSAKPAWRSEPGRGKGHSICQGCGEWRHGIRHLQRPSFLCAAELLDGGECWQDSAPDNRAKIQSGRPGLVRPGANRLVRCALRYQPGRR
jgi:hypothetical protein